MANEELARFLAHSVEMESEARACYLALAERMRSHKNTSVAEFFDRMARESQLHLEEVSEIGAGMDLPLLNDDEFDWPEGESPESSASGQATPNMSLREAILLALENERAAKKFYGSFAEISSDTETRRVAAQFAAEEASHAEQLVKRLASIKD
ncbi:rubrerythrin [Mangrovimicrobium sediminis]|uniref:Rubrerythrin n=1 Tax=Mangrovimicrobium sediminis TaxID=2562682 RepID=A0A4Z0LX73_9GAMM|nr:ferritin family protein [Haliea sp. SAOS-164]TGD71756.1 rubrerythrin [Haliea sp. SAOS-164]